MGQVTITIHGRQYDISCDDGQEAHLSRLGKYLDQKANQLAGATGPVSDTLLLVMTALLIADELSDVFGELDDIFEGGKGEARIEAEEKLVNSIDGATGRLESIAERLERA